VPAPATTSMGPCTCSMAWRWRSSGVNGAGRELDFEGGILAQNTTSIDAALNPICPRWRRLGIFRMCCLRCPRSSLASKCRERRISPARRCRPPFSISSAVVSKLSTSSEHTKAFVPVSAGGRGAGRFSRPPLDPPVSIVQYGIGRPGTSENFQPKTCA